MSQLSFLYYVEFLSVLKLKCRFIYACAVLGWKGKFVNAYLSFEHYFTMFRLFSL